jgi:hypothetical protein
MGNRPHLLILQQHHGPHNRSFRRRDNLPKRRWTTRESRQTPRNTLRCNAGRCSGRQDRKGQGNYLSSHSSKSSRWTRCPDPWSGSASRHQNACPPRVQNRPNRRRHTSPARWDPKTRRSTRSKSLISPTRVDFQRPTRLRSESSLTSINTGARKNASTSSHLKT